MSVAVNKTEFLPSDWSVPPLGEVIKPTRPRIKPEDKPDLPFIGMEHVEAHSMRLLGTVPAGTMKSSAVHFQAGDVLYGRLRPYLNKVYRPDFEGLCSAEFIVFPKSEHIDSKYLQYFLNSWEFVTYASHLNEGDRPRVDFKQLSPYPFPLAPLEQQKRIVAEIEKQFSRLDEAVANLKRVKANLKRYKAAVLKAAVKGKLTEEWRKQHPDAEPADKLLERILEERRKAAGKGKYKEPELSASDSRLTGWLSAQVGSICEIIDGDRGENYPKKGDFKNDGYCLFLSTKNVRPDGFLFDEMQFISKGKHESLRKGVLSRGDIVFTSRGTLGNIAHYDNRVPYNCVRINSGMFILRGFSCFMIDKYLDYYLKSPVIRAQIEKLQSGTAQPQLPIREFKTFVIKFPSKFEQEIIVQEVERRLSTVAEAEAQVDANLRRADRLRQSILKQAFSGQLAPQDEHDEPVSMLLERIRATQLAQTKQPSARQLKRRTPARKTGVSAPKPLPMVAESAATYGDAIADCILAAMQPGREYARADLVEPLALTTGQWNAAIQELKRLGKVRQAGEKRGAKYSKIEE